MVDFWTFGCILFEMLVGEQPFYHKNHHLMFDSIKRVVSRDLGSL
jgi:serine/threonine protein kinase